VSLFFLKIKIIPYGHQLNAMLVVLALLLAVCGCNARISISESTTWTASRSVNQQVVIEDGVTLTIKGEDAENPLLLQLSDNENVGGGFKIRATGSLILENIILTRFDNFHVEINAVSFVLNTGGFVSMSRVRCEHMTSCVQRFCCNGNQVIVKDSTFFNNTLAFTGEGRVETVKTSLFVGNHLALSGANWIMEDCVFLRNMRGSNAENTKFVRTLFIENERAVQDPHGSPIPFLEDSLFYRNRRGILPSTAKHASMSSVSFVENQVGIYCSSQLSTLDKVNFINNTEHNVVYAGIAASDVGENVYWGDSNAKAISNKIFDSEQGSQGGAVEFASYASEPYLHDIIVTIIKKHPTPLLRGLEKYFAPWQDKIQQVLVTTETAFDFTLLKEWNDDKFDIQLNTQADESSGLMNVTGSDNNTVQVPDDVASATLAPSQKNQRPVHKATIHVTDEDNAILFLSVAINICFFWIISVIVYEYCCRARWNATVEANVERDKEEKAQLMEQDGWVSYEEASMPPMDGTLRTRSTAFKDHAMPPESESVSTTSASRSTATWKQHTVKDV
jgi:hypothetical protein